MVLKINYKNIIILSPINAQDQHYYIILLNFYLMILIYQKNTKNLKR